MEARDIRKVCKKLKVGGCEGVIKNRENLRAGRAIWLIKLKVRGIWKYKILRRSSTGFRSSRPSQFLCFLFTHLPTVSISHLLSLGRSQIRRFLEGWKETLRPLEVGGGKIEDVKVGIPEVRSQRSGAGWLDD